MNDKGGFPPEKGVAAIQVMFKETNEMHTMRQYELVQVIQYLQGHPKTNKADLRSIEWNLLPLLDGHRGESPVTLERAIAEEPAFYCEVIRAVYRSTNEEAPKGDVPEDKKKLAENAHRLLRKWSIPPGLQSDDIFDAEKLKCWLVAVRKECEETGHLEVALITFGHVLIYAPADPDGLWIHKAVATVLNDEGSGKIRQGYRTGIFNSRGVVTVDPTGAPERELAKKYRQEADDAENAGFHRFATSLRELGDDYDRQAERIISEERFGGEE